MSINETNAIISDETALIDASAVAQNVNAGIESIEPGKQKRVRGRKAKTVADEPVADEPVADETVADEPVADETVADETVADEPVDLIWHNPKTSIARSWIYQDFIEHGARAANRVTLWKSWIESSRNTSHEWTIERIAQLICEESLRENKTAKRLTTVEFGHYARSLGFLNDALKGDPCKMSYKYTEVVEDKLHAAFSKKDHELLGGHHVFLRSGARQKVYRVAAIFVKYGEPEQSPLDRLPQPLASEQKLMGAPDPVEEEKAAEKLDAQQAYVAEIQENRANRLAAENEWLREELKFLEKIKEIWQSRALSAEYALVENAIRSRNPR
jgi:hypothetical protein